MGEHVSGNYEGMVIRNLHHHNCKGVILSWAVLGQGGHSHVNNNSNDYDDSNNRKREVSEFGRKCGILLQSVFVSALQTPEGQVGCF